MERATPLPPPPIQHYPRAQTPIPEAVPEPLPREDITGRIDLALAGKAQLPLKWILAAVVAVSTSVGSAYLDLRDGLRDRPSRQELREEMRQLKGDIRELLDQRLPPRGLP
jgi:hypothetical protein